MEGVDSQGDAEAIFNRFLELVVPHFTLPISSTPPADSLTDLPSISITNKKQAERSSSTLYRVKD